MKTLGNRPNPGYIHRKNSKIVERIREVVFGMQDGMVSTLGAITGIAVGSGDKFIVLLAGVAIISVESISMGIGSYISSRSQRKLIERMIGDAMTDIDVFPNREREELLELLINDGWSETTANIMAKEAGTNKSLMLREVAYRELQVSPDSLDHPVENGFFMFGSYIIGGLIPLSAYFFLHIDMAMYLSIAMTLFGLFILGVSITKYTKEKWYNTGGHILLFGSIALFV